MLGRNFRDICALKRPDVELLAPSHSALDLLSAPEIRSYLRRSKIDLVIHAAAKVGGIQANIDDPAAYLYENALISLNLIHAAVDAGIQDLINLGSSCMYPRDYTNPLREEFLLAAPLEPTNEGYALAKIMSARLCEYFNRQVGCRYRTLIPCNLFGRYDRYDLDRGHLVASILLKLHRARQEGHQSVIAWGDGTARREFLFCEELAEFIVCSIGRTDAFPDYLNLGYGSDFSVAEYYKMAAEVVDFRGEIEFEPNRPVGMKRKLLDSSKANAMGWSPKVSPLDGIRMTYHHFLQEMPSERLT
jgi:GDP-L-fucose synthase